MKKFLNYFNIFELNLYSRSYKSALIRIGISILVMLVVCVFRLNVTIANPVLNILTSLLVFAIMVFAILCFFVAAVECLQVGDNIKKYNEREKYK